MAGNDGFGCIMQGLGRLGALVYVAFFGGILLFFVVVLVRMMSD